MTRGCAVNRQNTFGVSVVTNFHAFKKFNVRSILDPPVKGAKAAESAKTDETSGDKTPTEDAKPAEEAK